MFRNQWIFDSSSCAVGGLGFFLLLLDFSLSNIEREMRGSQQNHIDGVQPSKVLNPNITYIEQIQRRKVYYLLRLTKSEPSGFFCNLFCSFFFFTVSSLTMDFIARKHNAIYGKN